MLSIVFIATVKRQQSTAYVHTEPCGMLSTCTIHVQIEHVMEIFPLFEPMLCEASAPPEGQNNPTLAPEFIL